MNVKLLLLFSFMAYLTACNGQSSAQKRDTISIHVGDTVSEFGSNIMVIHQDKNKAYWFGSWETGVYKFDGKNLIHFTKEHGLLFNRVDAIQEDKLGNIYFSGMDQNSMITKFDGKSFTHIKAIPSNDWKLEADDVWLLHAFQSDHKVFRLNGNTLYELTLPNPPNLDHPFEIYSIYKDSKGNVWFGTNPVGVCRFNGKAFDWITEEDVTEFRDEGANGVRSMTEDKNGDFWFNTENRYSIYDVPTINSKKFYTRHEGIGSLDGKNTSSLKEFLSTLRDNENNLWFVTYRNGVWKYDGSTITHYPVEENSKPIPLFTIFMDHKHELWLGTQENGVYKFNGKTFRKFYFP